MDCARIAAKLREQIVQFSGELSSGLPKGGPGTRGQAKSAGNHPDFSIRLKRESQKIFSGGLGGHQKLLIDDAVGDIEKKCLLHPLT